MALTVRQREKVYRSIVKGLSENQLSINITRNELRGLIDDVDSAVTTTNTSFLDAIPAGRGKTWLMSSADILNMVREHLHTGRREHLHTGRRES